MVRGVSERVGGRRSSAKRAVPVELSCMIRVDGHSYCIDPVGGVTDALGKKWTLPLIGILGNRSTNRFGDLLAGLRGVGAKALSGRLRELQGLGLVSREVFAEVPVRVEYRLTIRGAQLRRALVPLLEWAASQEGQKLTQEPTRAPS